MDEKELHHEALDAAARATNITFMLRCDPPLVIDMDAPSLARYKELLGSLQELEVLLHLYT